MNSKISDPRLQKVPYMLVVGDREAEARGVEVRLRSGEALKTVAVEAIVERMLGEVRARG